MSTAKKPTTTSIVTLLQTLIAGLTNSPPSTLKSMIIGGMSMTLAQVISALQAYLTLYTTVTSTRAAWRAAVAAKKAGLIAGRALYEGVVAVLKQYYGTNQASLAPFGITVPAPRAKPSSDTKAIAHAKALATREARNTMGSKQRKAIKATPQAALNVTLPSGGSGTPGGTPSTPAAPAAAAAPAGAAPAAAPAAPVPVAPAPTH